MDSIINTLDVNHICSNTEISSFVKLNEFDNVNKLKLKNKINSDDSSDASETIFDKELLPTNAIPMVSTKTLTKQTSHDSTNDSQSEASSDDDETSPTKLSQSDSTVTHDLMSKAASGEVIEDPPLVKKDEVNRVLQVLSYVFDRATETNGPTNDPTSLSVDDSLLGEANQIFSSAVVIIC
jgi:hypothetical protein